MATEISNGIEYIESKIEGADLISPAFNSEKCINADCTSVKYIEVSISVQEEL